jgi:hypothetical protein
MSYFISTTVVQSLTPVIPNLGFTNPGRGVIKTSNGRFLCFYLCNKTIGNVVLFATTRV